MSLDHTEMTWPCEHLRTHENGYCIQCGMPPNGIIAALRDELARRDANPQIGTCQACGGVIWRKSGMLTVGERQFHPMCFIVRQRDDLLSSLRSLSGVIPHQHCATCNQFSEEVRLAIQKWESLTK